MRNVEEEVKKEQIVEEAGVLAKATGAESEVAREAGIIAAEGPKVNLLL